MDSARDGGARVKTGRWILALVVVFAVGLGLGLVGGLFVFDDDDTVATSGDTATPEQPEVDCDEAQSVVDKSLGALEEIGATEEQDRSFYAAVLVEQSTIVYAMETAPSCFTLEERADAQGLFDGVKGLLDSSPTAIQTVPAATEE